MPSKLEKMTEALLEGLVSEDQVQEIFEAVVKLITEATNKNDLVLAEQDKAIDDFGVQISTLFENTTAAAESQQEIVDNAVALVNELRQQVAEMVLEDGEDADISEAVELVMNEVEPKLEAIKAMIPEVKEQPEITKEEIRDKIASLQGEEKLSVKDLKDWDAIEADFSRRMSRIGHGSASSTGGASTFLSLTDTPSDFTGQAGLFPKVNAEEDALEFVAIPGGGDMLAATYDPTAVNGDAFAMDNMVEGATTKILTATERAAIAANTAKVTNATHTGDVTGDTALTIEDEAVTFAKMQHIATNRILGRSTAATGDIEALADGAVRDIIGLATSDSPQFAGVNVGHATDTTISRVSAGVIAVEGTTVQLQPTEGGFVDGDKTKLDGVEASADVTDTANVTAAGALMESEVTNLAQVKAFDTTDYATAAHTHLLAAGATDVTATAAELNTLDGITATVTELNYTDGVTSPIQTQLDAAKKKRFAVRLVETGTDVATGTTVGGDYRIYDGAITITGVGAYVDTAGTTGVSTIDINEAGTTILSTKITIDSAEKTSETAATAPVISDSAIAADGIVTFDVDGVSTTAPQGLVVWVDYTIN